MPSCNADVALSKSAPSGPVAEGLTITYSIGLENLGPNPAQNVTLTDSLPASTRFVSLSAPAGWACLTPAPGASGAVTCTKAGMARLETGSFTLVLRVCPDVPGCGADVVNTATVTSACDQVAANDSQTSTTASTELADLAVSSSHAPAPVLAGSQVTYTVVVTNAGPSADPGPSLTYTLPGGWTLASASGAQGACGGIGSSTGACALGAPGSCGPLPASATITLVVDVPPGASSGAYASTFSVTGGTCQADADPSDNQVVDSTTVSVQSDLWLFKADAPDPVASGRDIAYTLTITNLGPSVAYGVRVTDPLPGWTNGGSPPVRYRGLRTPPEFTCTAPYPGTSGTVVCDATGPLKPGTYLIGIHVSAPPLCGKNAIVTNTATLFSLSPDPDYTNNAATQTTKVNGGPCFQ